MLALPARLLARELRESRSDADLDGILRARGLAPDALDEAHYELPWTLCQELAGDFAGIDDRPDLGLRAGLRAQAGDLDLPALYLRAQPNHGEAAALYHRHRDAFTLSRAGDVYFTGRAAVVACSTVPGLQLHPLLADCLLAACLQLARVVMGPIEPAGIHLRRDEPTDSNQVAVYREVFGRVPCFSSHLDAIMLPLGSPEHPLPYGDRTLAQGLAPHVQRRVTDIRAGRADLIDGAVRVIERELTTGNLSVNSLARALRLSPRSLRRALQSRGTSYSELVDRVRGDTARRLALQLPFLSGPVLARRIGYADAHVLYRAFPRWTGYPLSEFRRRHFDDLECCAGDSSPVDTPPLDSRRVTG
jgi:AraC-like DNA-binding protein